MWVLVVRGMVAFSGVSLAKMCSRNQKTRMCVCVFKKSS